METSKKQEGAELYWNEKIECMPRDEIKKMQEDRYAEMFEIMRKYKKVIKNVTFWNLGDRDSWLGARNYPLLWDENYEVKNVYYVVRDFKKNKKK